MEFLSETRLFRTLNQKIFQISCDKSQLDSLCSDNKVCEWKTTGQWCRSTDVIHHVLWIEYNIMCTSLYILNIEILKNMRLDTLKSEDSLADRRPVLLAACLLIADLPVRGSLNGARTVSRTWTAPSACPALSLRGLRTRTCT